MARKLHTRIPLTATAGARARQSLEPIRHTLDPESFETLRLLVTELVNNSQKHSGRPQGDPIELTVELSSRHVRAEVVDQGGGGDVLRPAPEPDSESGWGLYLLDRLAETWGYSGEGPTRVWFTIPIQLTGELGPLTSWPQKSQAGSA
jgi:anti-sigma regulatory factor (Ser/Thr protein kinase)